MGNVVARLVSICARCEGPLWALLIFSLSFTPDLRYGFSGAWLVSGVGLVVLLRLQRMGLIWLALGAAALSAYRYSQVELISVGVVAAGVLFTAIMVFQCWFAWRAIVWLERRQSSPLLSRAGDVFPFALLVCLLPAVLGILIWTAVSILFYGYEWSDEAFLPTALAAVRNAMGFLLIGPLYWAIPRLKQVSIWGMLLGWLFFTLPVILNEEIYFGLAIIAYPAAILIAKWLRFAGIAVAVVVSSLISLNYITLSVADYEPFIIAEWLLDAVLFSTTLGIVALYSAIAFEELEVRGEQLEKLVARRTRDLEQANRRLMEIASVDSLTGLANRRQWNSRAELAVAQAAFTGESLSVLIVDIDHFKQVNDNYGHDAGDVVLKEFATRCGDVLRTGDTFARLGGEEFAVMLPSIDLHSARLVADKMIEMVRSELFVVTEQQSIAITASVGVAEWRVNEENLSLAMRRADEALYRAKEQGRDRVMLEPHLSVS